MGFRNNFRNSSHKVDAKFIIDLFNSKKEILRYVSYILKSKINGNLELSYQDLMLMEGKKDNIDPNRNLHADWTLSLCESILFD